MKQYPKYKDSEVNWIDEIPEHWQIKKLKYFAQIVNGQDQKEVVSEEGEYPILGTGGVFGRSKKFLYDKPSVLLGRKGTIDNPFYIEEPFWTVDTLFYTRIFKNVFPKYFFYSCRCIDFSMYKTGSAVPSMTQETLLNIQRVYPPYNEQIAIASFLDKKTVEIDELIAAKEELITKLEAQRKAIINEAVTGQAYKTGLIPFPDGKPVKFKDSGIDWLGEIPEHWEVKKLKYLIKSQLQYGANESAELDDPELPRYIRITDFGDNGQLKDETFKSLPIEKAEGYYLNSGDLLFARSGATVGKTFLFKNYNGKACFAGYLIRATVNNLKMDSNFLYIYTKSSHYLNWKNSIFSQATIQNIGADKYKNLPVPVPPIKEQLSISEIMEEKTTEIESIISVVADSIVNLKKFKQSLISEAVTGKIDVRNWQKD